MFSHLLTAATDYVQSSAYVWHHLYTNVHDIEQGSGNIHTICFINIIHNLLLWVLISISKSIYVEDFQNLLFSTRKDSNKSVYENRILMRILQLWNQEDMDTFCMYSVMPRHCFSIKSARVISLSGVQLSGFIHLSHVKTAIFDIVFWGFHIIFFFVFNENTNN